MGSAALVASIGAMAIAGPASADQGVVQVQRGANGRDGESAFFWSNATAGQDAAASMWVQTSPISGVAPALEIGSVGGAGGSAYSKGVIHNVPGKPGGSGGLVSLDIFGGADIFGTLGIFTQAKPLISVYSFGGTGGLGYTSWTDADGGIARGGDGGQVNLNIGSIIIAGSDAGTRTVALPAIKALSQGGAAGIGQNGSRSQDGTYASRTDTDRGGSGGMVTVGLDQYASVSVTGDLAPAVYAGSLGGNGGNASNSGGYPSNGGGGGSVNFINQGTITTDGNNSAAVILQSAGGAGGTGAAGAFTSGTPGGTGGAGGVVTGNNAGMIATQGDYSFGIMAQSVGGVGGNGGGAAFTSGGNGGGAGLGGVVSVTNEGAISTTGIGATAIMAQSIGGGSALDAFYATTPVISSGGGGSGGGSGILPFASGGTGGLGGVGGNVAIDHLGSISTAGDAAYGVLAQSIGGGGGTGGKGSSSLAFLAVALGGTGGGGGDGGQVSFDSVAGSSIQTLGQGATGVLAQSIGGGGGTGGYATSKSVSPGLSVSSATGGSGGKGGAGGLVSITNNSTIQTAGETAFGLQASSIGGGGGTGGGANAFAVAFPVITPSGQTLPSFTVTNAVGGSGGDGGAGALAMVNNNAGIETFGVGATGILAQSIGGGGGNAGNAYAYGLAVAAPGSSAFNVTNSIGGSGGGGGTSVGARVVNSASVLTSGDGAFGIQVQSIGGGGGNSGSASASADALSLYRTVTFGQTIGGTNNVGGGSGGLATVDNDGLVQTRGTGATGILLQSIGGGGGNGGAVNAASASGLSFDKTLDSLVKQLPLADSISIVNAIGGNGGNGGNGGIVNATLTSNSVIRTLGAQSDGILAQSIGGGGGTGGGGSAAASGKLSFNLSFGGKGGAGGSGGTVAVNNAGNIQTYGDASHGVFAQSIGGGGGNGGNLAAAEAAPDTVGELFAALKKAVGVEAYQNWAKDQNNADKKAELDALIKDIQDSSTYKDLSAAFKNSDMYKEMQAAGKSVSTYLKAQADGSVKRPDLSLTLSLGGNGGTGNAGGLINLTNSGGILTTGDVSYGMLGQSIGGGGGQGGVAYASGTNKTNLSGTLGGTGGLGNVGGNVNLTNQGGIQTWGSSSYGLYAESVGGGGGIGVGALSSGNKNLVLNFTMGGSGGTGANGGAITVTNTGTIDTHGDEAHGIVAQSVGGGGGAFMMSTVGKASSTAPTATDDNVASAASISELLKAVGIEQVPAVSPEANGKEPSSKSGSVTLGGAGGASGAGGAVNVTHSGVVTTSGLAAFGIFAQSIGGGGGISNAAGSPGGVKYAASYGGKGGSSGNGGAINVNFADGAYIGTTGDYSTAVYAQSVGGGGGYGGASVLQGYTLPIFSGTGGTSGTGGNISISTSSGSTIIRTGGAQAHGVFAQSLGGGGGTVSQALKTDQTARAALKQSADVLTAIVSQVGGTGTILNNIDKVPESLQGVVRLFGNDTDTVNNVLTALTTALNQRSASLGTGGDISMNLNGDIRTSGAGSYGLFAQSGFQQSDGSLDPTRPGGKITISYSGVLQGGSGAGAAIVVDGGSNENTITINKGAYVSALSGHAVISTFGRELLSNFGTLVGDIDLASGGTQEGNNVRNEAGGTYVSGGSGIVNLGDGPGRFYNVGTFDVGGVGTIATATIKGGEYTHLGGTLRVDVNSIAAAGKQNADLFKASYLRVDGVAIKPHAVQGLLPGTSFTVVSADTLDVRTPAVSGASSASPISWAVTRNANGLMIAPAGADFAGKAQGNATDTERSLLSSLQRAWDAGVNIAGIFAGMANVDSAQSYENALNSLAVSEDLGQSAARQTLAGRKSLNAALSCPVFDGDTTMLRETQCTWARITGSRLTQSDTSVADGSKQEGLSYRVGGQWEIRPDWFFGATAAYNTSTMHTNDGLVAVRGQGGDVSFSLKHQAGPWLLAGAVHAGYGNYDSDALFIVGDEQWRAENRNDVWTAGLRTRAAYEVAGNDWYVRPYVDLDFLRSYMPGYTLSGEGATLRAAALKQWTVVLTPTIEAGSRIAAGRFGWLRPYLSVGASFLKSGGSSNKVSLSDSGGGEISFTSKSALPDRLINLGAGVQLYAKDKYEVRAEYQARRGQSMTDQELSVRMAIAF